MFLDTYNYKSRRMFYPHPRYYVSKDKIHFREIIADNYSSAKSFFCKLEHIAEDSALCVRVVYNDINIPKLINNITS